MARPCKPTALLELEKGKLYDQQRDRAALEPKPERELKPRCPARFSKEERKAWNEIAAVLKNYGLFTAANAIQLELLSTAWAQYISVSAELTADPKIIIKGPDGGRMYNPYFNAQHRLGTLVDKYSQNLGLSSIALAKIGSLMLKGKKQKSEMEDLLD
ncbi:MAG: P27 family phage terminase small subunit [Pseudomonadota bacterium]